MTRVQAGHSKHPFPTAQEMTLPMEIIRWSVPKSYWLYSLQPKMEKFWTVSKNKPGADCGSDHELLIAKFRLKLKKVGKTTRPLRYDINQISYDHTMEMMNRLKRLDLVDRVIKNDGLRLIPLYRRWWLKPSQRKRNARRQSACLRRI